jgi:hypothetical protein
MRSSYFPFHTLGFRSNPFRALTDEEWADIVVLPQTVLDAAAGGRHLQVLGELGHGKTSTLLGLAQQFRHAGRRVTYEYLPIGYHTFTSPLTGLEVFLLDEVQRLRPAERRRLLAAASAGLRLILGSHEDLAPLFSGAGLSLASVRLDESAPVQLTAILARRLAYFALPGAQPGVTLDPSAVAYLEAKFGANRRAVDHFLYEVFQRLEAPTVITAEHLQALAAAHPETLPK